MDYSGTSSIFIDHIYLTLKAELKSLLIMALLLLSMLAIAQPSNDICDNAIMLAVDGTCQTYSNVDATASNHPRAFMHCGENFDPAHDIWFSIVAPPSGVFTIELNGISGGISTMSMELYSGSCSGLSLLGCSNSKNSNASDFAMPIIERENMIAGQTYYIKVASNQFIAFGSFEICVAEQGYNQFPCRIESVEATGQSICDPITNTYSQELTIHYRDIAGQSTGLYLIDSLYPLLPSPMVITVENIPANTGWQQIYPQMSPISGCYDDAGLFVYNGFKRQANCYSGSVVNDDCVDAIILNPDQMCVSFTANNLGASHSGTGGFCEPFTQGAQDIWFQHTTTSTDDIIVNVWGDSDIQPSGLVYTGSCGVLNFQACVFDDRSARLIGLTVGETIYIQVKDTNDDDQGDFNLCLIYPEPTSNDICQNAIVIPSTGSCDMSKVYSNHLATDDNGLTQPQSCYNNSTNDLWYQLTVDANGTLSVELPQVVTGDIEFTRYVEIYEGTCVAFSLVKCETLLYSSSTIELINRTPGEIVYLRVLTDLLKPYLVCTTQLSNNFCEGAQDIPVGTCMTTDNIDATASDNPYPGILCGSNNSTQDVWYSATVPSSGNLTIESFQVQNGLSDVYLEVYEGADCAMLNPIACSDRKDINGNSLNHGKIELESRSPGEKIFIRMVSPYDFNYGDFEICITDAGYTQICKIDLIEIVSESSCDPATNTYDVDLLVHYRDDGSASFLNLLNNTYPISSSPQLISVSLPASGSSLQLDVSFTGGSNCYDYYFFSNAIQAPSPCIANSVVNDECVNAFELSVTRGCLEAIFDNTGATFSSEVNFTCYGNDVQDIWFYAEVPQSGELIINAWQSGQVFPAFEIYEGVCGNLNRIEDCGLYDRSIRLSGRQPGEVLYVLAYSSDTYSQGEFGLCAIEPEAHINDTCTDAVGFLTYTSCATSVYSTHIAQAENGSIDCNGPGESSNDIWFSVISPNSGDLTLRTEEVEYGTSHVVMEVYSGSCQSPFTTCAVMNSADGHAEINLTGLTAGNDLYVRVASRYEFQPITFSFCATSSCPDQDVIIDQIPDVRDYEADISINSISRVLTGADVTFDAGMMVSLDPGFEVEAGAVFHAFIDGCGGQ